MAIDFDQDIASEILTATKAGASPEVAAAYADIDVVTARRWMKDPSPAARKWARSIEKARADLQLLAVGSLRRNVQEDPQAARYLAEKMGSDMELERLRELTT